MEVDKSQAQGGIHSLIPLLYADLGNAQAAVDHTTQMLIHNMDAFEEAVHHLSITEDDSSNDQSDRVHCFVQGCRAYCSGYLTWRFGFFLF